MVKYIALDFETGGLDPKRHGVCSLGVAIFEDGNPVDQCEWTVAPPKNRSGRLSLEYDAGAFAINGYTLDKLNEGKPEIDVMHELSHFVMEHRAKTAMIVSHNTAFDAAFLSEMVFRCGTFANGRFEAYPEPLLGPWACTRRMMQILGLPNSRLDTLIGHFGLYRTSEFHGALEDAILCGQAYWLLREKARGAA